MGGFIGLDIRTATRFGVPPDLELRTSDSVQRPAPGLVHPAVAGAPPERVKGRASRAALSGRMRLAHAVPIPQRRWRIQCWRSKSSCWSPRLQRSATPRNLRQPECGPPNQGTGRPHTLLPGAPPSSRPDPIRRLMKRWNTEYRRLTAPCSYPGGHLVPAAPTAS